MTFTSLVISSSALAAAQRGMDTVAHNVANVGTEGYTRRRVELSEAPTPQPLDTQHALTGIGVRVNKVQRIRDEFVDVTIRTQASLVGEAAVGRSVSEQAERILGPTDSGVLGDLSRFWSAWERVAARPDDQAVRQEVVSAGRQLVRGLRDAARDLGRLRSQVSEQLGSAVTRINQLNAQIAALNTGITRAGMSGEVPGDLLDQRDRLLDELSRLSGATTQASGDGGVRVYVGTMPAVAGPDMAMIGLSADSGAAPAGHPVWAADGAPIALGGELGGLVEAAELTLPNIAAELDHLTLSVRDAVNGVHGAGFDLDGAAGGAFFTGSGAADLDLASTLGPRQVAASSAGAVRDGRQAQAIADLGRRGVGSAGVDAVAHQLVGHLGQLAATSRREAESAEAVHGESVRRRADTSAPSVDEELSDLLRYQRSYEAAGRVLTAADDLLDRLINGTGRVGR